MAVYTVHAKAGSPPGGGDTVFVRDGFSWPAALFTVLWALYHRLWWWALALVVLAAVLGAGAGWLELNDVARAAVEMGFLVLVGFHANDWRRSGLEARGYVLEDIVGGKDLAGAERRFFERRAERAGSSPASREVGGKEGGAPSPALP